MSGPEIGGRQVSRPIEDQSIEFVYFDLGNVLVSFDAAIACQNIATLFGCSQQQADDVVYNSGLQDRFEHGAVSVADYSAEVRLGMNSDSGQVSDEVIMEAISAMFTPIDSMAGVIAKTRQSGRRVGILSNTCEAHWDWIVRQKYRLMEGPFDVTILSCRVGSMKPDEPIYVAAEQAAGVRAGAILFLDDKPENVQAAIERGWKAEQCFGGDQAVEALRKHGIDCC